MKRTGKFLSLLAALLLVMGCMALNVSAKANMPEITKNGMPALKDVDYEVDDVNLAIGLITDGLTVSGESDYVLAINKDISTITLKNYCANVTKESAVMIDSPSINIIIPEGTVTTFKSDNNYEGVDENIIIFAENYDTFGDVSITGGGKLKMDVDMSSFSGSEFYTYGILCDSFYDDGVDIEVNLLTTPDSDEEHYAHFDTVYTVNGDLTFKNCDIKANLGDNGKFAACYGGDILVDNCTAEVKSGDNCLDANDNDNGTGNITVKNCKKLDLHCTYDEPIWACSHVLFENCDEVTLENNANQCVDADLGIEFKNCGKIKLTSTDEQAIYNESGDVVFENCAGVEIKVPEDIAVDITDNGSLIIKNCKNMKIISDSDGIFISDGNVEITDSDVEVQAKSTGIIIWNNFDDESANGSLKLKNASLKVKTAGNQNFGDGIFSTGDALLDNARLDVDALDNALVCRTLSVINRSEAFLKGGNGIELDDGAITSALFILGGKDALNVDNGIIKATCISTAFYFKDENFSIKKGVPMGNTEYDKFEPLNALVIGMEDDSILDIKQVFGSMYVGSYKPENIAKTMVIDNLVPLPDPDPTPDPVPVPPTSDDAFIALIACVCSIFCAVVIKKIK